MKNNQPVTEVETDSAERRILASRTDPKGHITYANRAFIDVSGFDEAELIGARHNIVRHPDMPAEVFADLWKTVQAGRPWTGIVKNRCKNGDRYRVKATVTPVLQNGRTVEFMSLRVRPGRQPVSAGWRASPPRSPRPVPGRSRPGHRSAPGPSPGDAG